MTSCICITIDLKSFCASVSVLQNLMGICDELY